MAERRKLHLRSEADAIAEINRLRQGYDKTRQWSLPQIAFHTWWPIDNSLHKPESMDQTEQQKRMAPFVGKVAESGWPAERLDAPTPMVPPDNTPDSAVDDLLNALQRMQAWPHAYVATQFFGPVAIGMFRAFALNHIAHHLSFLMPSKPARRSGLQYPDEDAVIADIQKLRGGYAQGGAWSLPQICWHLDITTNLRMKPGPHPANTPEQDARRATFEQVLASGQLPPGIVAPDVLVPPANLGDDAVDQFLATLQTWKAYSGEIAPHRIFGRLTKDEGKRINRIHCAHHLSYLSPL